MGSQSRWKWAAAGLILTAIGAAGHAQQPTPSQEPPDQPVFRTGINVVRVDVIVTDSKTGQPVTDLEQGDFQITENDQPQTIDTFRFIQLDGGVTSPDRPREIRTDSDEEIEAAREDVRLFGIFLDDYHTRRGASVSVREPIARFISTQLGPTDMVGLMYPLQPVSAVRMTRDHDRVIQALGTFVGRKGDYEPRNPAEYQYANYPAEEVERIRNQISLSALESLINHMGSLKEGRKALILVSEGYSNSLPPQLRDPVASLPGLDNPDRDNPDAGDNPREQTRTFFNDSQMSLQLREVWDAANKNNVAIYAVDPRGLPVSEFDLSQPTMNTQTDRQYLNASMDTLRTLAAETDGRAIVNRNDLAAGMTQIVRDTSSYYLIGYNSNQSTSDGKFHEIKVRVNRPGIQVRTRRGYWALTVQDVARAAAPKTEPNAALSSALASIAVPTASHNIVRTWIGSSRGADGKTKVTFVWEPATKASDPRSEVPTGIMVMAVGPDGDPYYRGRSKDSRVTFDAAPGKVQLRVTFEGSDQQVLDTEQREFAVPDLTGSDSVFGTPQVFRARTARDYQLIKGDLNAVPTPSREFSRTERLLVRVPAYSPGDAPVEMTAQLLTRTGQTMNAVKVTPAATAPEVQEIELQLAGLAPGEYVLEIKGGDAQELVGFRVTP